MPRADVIARLGTPNKIETIGNTEFLFYSPPWWMQLGITVKGGNPIAIADGKIVGMGWQYYYDNSRGVQTGVRE